jgi:alkanesulfonate monooxygenase SsuD/methylene tetrahydromethanopterin reductase-like flavin-dependent oxidoreductase (luciferase family)
VPQGDRARRRAVEFSCDRFLVLYDAWGHGNVMELEGRARSAAGLDADHFVDGEAVECVDRIARYAALGVGEIACLMNFGGPEEATAERSMRLFAEQVVPRAGDR